MIIDKILDRKDGELYNARDFYFDVLQYSRTGDEITRAMDGGTEDDVKKALCDFITGNEYNPQICDYIKSVEWLSK